MSENQWQITAVYHFTPILQRPWTPTDLQVFGIQNGKSPSVSHWAARFEKKASEFGIYGLMILGEEGLNMTCACADSEGMAAWKSLLTELLGAPLNFKDSESNKAPFRQFKIKIRDEIVTAGLPGISPPAGKNHHLSPEEWNQAMEQDPNAVVIDTRNWYEYKIGSFENAVNPNIEKFTEFPKWLEAQGYEKEKKMLIFCTGGIRCEKGILELEKQGYNNVYQLDGGILNYLKEKPNSHFWGECFVFDNRVAVDQKLQPTKVYDLCPHCGNPANIQIDCARCETTTRICSDCQNLAIRKETCSKNCAHWWELKPGQKGARQLPPNFLRKSTLVRSKETANPS